MNDPWFYVEFTSGNQVSQIPICAPTPKEAIQKALRTHACSDVKAWGPAHSSYVGWSKMVISVSPPMLQCRGQGCLELVELPFPDDNCGTGCTISCPGAEFDGCPYDSVITDGVALCVPCDEPDGGDEV